MKFCTNCGSKINSEAKFCASCGTPIKNENTNNTDAFNEKPAHRRRNNPFTKNAEDFVKEKSQGFIRDKATEKQPNPYEDIPFDDYDDRAAEEYYAQNKEKFDQYDAEHNIPPPNQQRGQQGSYQSSQRASYSQKRNKPPHEQRSYQDAHSNTQYRAYQNSTQNQYRGDGNSLKSPLEYLNNSGIQGGVMHGYINVIKQFKDFKGRASKKEYWMFVLFNFGFTVLAFFIDKLLGTSLFYGMYSLALLVPSLAVTVRRLHDTGKSGWMILVSIIPILGAIWLLILLIKNGEKGANLYGLPPNV